jgi:hypothetical protein
VFSSCFLLCSPRDLVCVPLQPLGVLKRVRPVAADGLRVRLARVEDGRLAEQFCRGQVVAVHGDLERGQVLLVAHSGVGAPLEQFLQDCFLVQCGSNVQAGVAVLKEKDSNINFQEVG